MTYTPGRYILADTDAYGMRDMPGLTAQVKLMRETFEAGIEKQPGLIIIAVDDSERNSAKGRVLNALSDFNALDTAEELRELLFQTMIKLHQLPGVLHCGTDLEDKVIEALSLPEHNGVDYASYWRERALERDLDD
jgi:hypothetical protein